MVEHQPWEDFIEWEYEKWLELNHRRFALDVHYPWFIYIWEHFCSSINKMSFDRALDIGIGASGGFISIINSVGERIGLDPLVDKLDHMLPNKRKIKYVQGYGEDLPFENESIDLVIISNALEHCKSMEETSSEIRRVLKKGGYLLVHTFYFNDSNHPHSIDSKSEVHDLISLEVVEEHEHRGKFGLMKKNPFYTGIFKK